MQIKNISPTLPEVGKIKIGVKGQMMTSKGGKKFQPPKKLDHFVVTSIERGEDGNFIKNQKIHDLVGETPKALDVRLLYDDPGLNFQSRYTCYQGTKLSCYGDGESGNQLDQKQNIYNPVQCPCNRVSPLYTGKDKCKTTGLLSVILEKSPIVGGVWKFRTTSYNTVVNIMSGLAMISRITGGLLAGLPLQIVIIKKSTVIPTTQQATLIHTVGIIYKGTMQELAEEGARVAIGMATQRAKIDQIENNVKLQIAQSVEQLTANETTEDVIEEFYPEQVQTTQQSLADTIKNGKEPVKTALSELKPETQSLVDEMKKNMELFEFAMVETFGAPTDITEDNFDEFVVKYNELLEIVPK